MSDATLGAKGSKKEAYSEWSNMIETPRDAELIIRAYQEQAEAKKKLQELGQFFAPFPHLNRYIKHERFDDEIEQSTNNTDRKTRDDARREEYQRYLEH